MTSALRTAGFVGSLILVVGCGGGGEAATTSGDTSVTNSTADTVTTSTVPDTTTTGDSSAPETIMTIDPGLQPLIEQAKADLAQRLGVAESEIEVASAELVTWPDASLGCPQPGMQYAQVLTDGSKILLRHAGQTYPYHTGGSRYVPFLCENTK